MGRVEIARHYFEAFHSGRIEEVLSLFAEDGAVHYGTESPKPASQFFPETKDFIARVEFETHGIFSSQDTDDIVIHFSFTMPQEDGTRVTIVAVDIIEFDADDKIKRVTVIPNM